MSDDIHEPYWRQSLLFPYRIAIGWWLDTFLCRPSDTWATRMVRRDLDWFMARRDLRLIQNPCFHNLLGVYLNAKMVTLRSPTVELRFTALVGAIQVRSSNFNGKWKAIHQVLPEIVELPNNNLLFCFQFIDQNWERVMQSVSE